MCWAYVFSVVCLHLLGTKYHFGATWYQSDTNFSELFELGITLKVYCGRKYLALVEEVSSSVSLRYETGRAN